MGANPIAEALKNKSLTVAEFSRQIGMSQQTLYNVVKKKSIENISIGTFIKIAQGLGVTAEELYYGESHAPRVIYSDARQVELNGHYESLNEDSKDDLVGFVKSFAADPERRISKDGAEDAGISAAMGA